ncbi:MAG: cytochrome C [Rubrivivax sp.]|nr:cytochrome C [Rubrivivax sp.]
MILKAAVVGALLAFGVLGAGVATASPELAKAQCGKCHDMDKKSKGPSFKAMAAKFKGNEAGALKAIQDPKGDHPEMKSSPADVQTVVKWMLTL